MNANLILLTLCQGLFFTNNVTFIAINGLVGLSMAPLGWMATLPVMGYVVGGALSTGLVARSQARWGRKTSFQLGLGVALLSALSCAAALHWHSFWLLVASTLVAGYYSANGQLYRFAAGELAAPAFREKAVSLVLAGGLIGAIAGPNLAQQTRDSLGTPFLAAYLALALVALLLFVGWWSLANIATGFVRSAVELGAARFAAGDPLGAASAFRRLIALDPRDAQAWARLGESLVVANDNQIGGDAEAAFREALKLDPDQLGARFFLGEAALRRGDAVEARTLWTPLIAALDPADPRRLDLERRLPKGGAQ